MSDPTGWAWRVPLTLLNSNLTGIVGIGTNNPQARLHVVTDNARDQVVSFGTTNRDQLFVVRTNGVVGIGTNNPQARAHIVADNVRDRVLSVGTTNRDDQFVVRTNGAATTAVGSTASNAVVGGTLYRAVFIPAKTNLNTTITTFTNAGEYIVKGNSLTQNLDTACSRWTGRLLPGTNAVKLVWGYEVALSTGTFTNGDTGFEAGMDVTRTAGVGAWCDVWFTFSQVMPTLVSANLAGFRTNLFLNSTNGTDITNVLQIASNRAGGFSNNTHVVFYQRSPQ